MAGLVFTTGFTLGFCILFTLFFVKNLMDNVEGSHLKCILTGLGKNGVQDYIHFVCDVACGLHNALSR